MSVYDEPLYYEIAFSFVDPEKQVSLFEELIRRFSGIEARRFLDIGCGPGLQLREIARRGYEAVGLDRSPRMLEHLEREAELMGVSIETFQADMNDFSLEKRADFAFTMMGTICYAGDNRGMLSHLGSVAASLNRGGLYLIENLRLDWASEGFFGAESWTIERNGIQVKTTYEIRLEDALTQMLEERMTLEVDDHGSVKVLEERATTKMIFPQEFLTLVELQDQFEFIGWFERDKPERLEKASMDNIALLRRR
ncbi:MAG: class I SAM-dependent methyltransferase [Candidatus Bathyarchaeota archaeon]|nr:MAG: class I SAM-dependent methyltransferase [Candidatus Bathyarchaeota archaeon]